MNKAIKVIGVLFLGLFLFSATNYEFDGLQTIINGMSFNLVSFVLSIIIGYVVFKISKKPNAGCISAGLFGLFIQLGGLSTGEVNIISFIIAGTTVYLATNFLVKDEENVSE